MKKKNSVGTGGYAKGLSGLSGKEAPGKKRRRSLLRDESGAGVIEVILILVVLIAVVILFKEQILSLAQLIFGDIFTKAESVF